jgi:superfamily I DNA/RNA helicase
LPAPGTGKTRVITTRVAYMIERGIDPAHILAVTFTNKAAAEMRERLAKMIDKAQAKKVTMSTFHALCLPYPAHEYRSARLQTELQHLRRGRSARVDQEDHHAHGGQG